MDLRKDAALGALLRQHATRHTPSAALTGRLQQRLRAEAARPLARPQRRRWIEALALYTAGALSAWVAASALLVLRPPDTLTQQVTASHLRSLQANHLTDVPSSSHHVVKPWFAGRLDFSPPVADLAAEGYPLVGGRLDDLDGRPVAALVYRHDAHVINLFVWPQTAPAVADSAPQATVERGYRVLRWNAGGMQAWAVSDMDEQELRAFAHAVNAALAAPRAPPGVLTR